VTTTPVFDEKAAAAYVGLSVKTLQARRCAHKAPPYIKVGRSVRYLKSDLDALLAGCRVDPEGQN
jgi:predicted DNA-binding transcriptional regulator AlpA